MRADLVLYAGITGREPMLVMKPLENALGRMVLLAVPDQIFLQQMIDCLGETTQFGLLDRCRPAIHRRH